MKYDTSSTIKTYGLAIIIAALTAGVILLCSIMMRRSNQIIWNETNRYLEEISAQSSYKVNQQVNYDLNALHAIAENLDLFQDIPDRCDDYLVQAVNRYSFIWIGHVSPDGMLMTKPNELVDASSSPVIQEALQGQDGVSSSLLTDPNGNPGILYAVPFLLDGVQKGALVGWTRLENMHDVLAAETFNGQGFSHIISQNGDFILHSDNPNSILGADNLYEVLLERAEFIDKDLDDVIADIDSGRSGHFHIRIDGEIEEDMNYLPLAYGNWYLISVAPADVYASPINSFTQSSVAINLAIMVIFIVLVIMIVVLDKRKNAEIMKIAYVDPVTGGFNSLRFEEEAKALLNNSKPFAFLCLDIRRFKLINDSFGSLDGNRVLRHVHDTIKHLLDDGESVARISADTFNLLFLTTSQDEIVIRIQELSEEINLYNMTLNAPYFLPIDCGVYIVEDASQDIITIRDRANTARKANKDNREYSQRLFSCAFYTDVERIHLLKEKDIENNMERALGNKEFVVYLQPKVDLSVNRVVGAEALVRWQTLDHGLVPPNDFIPFFEKNGFIRKLDLYMFEQVCQMLRGWIDRGLNPVSISVNLSRVHLRVPDFLDEFKRIQERYAVPPELLEIELTETMVFENLDFLKNVVDQIHSFGFRCSMDDFGSGYSSLNVLKDVPVDILKLDKVFFDKDNDERGNDVIESVIQLAKKLGMVTISEGVETIQQVEFLKQVKCDLVQGYVFSRPIPVSEFEKLVYF